MELSSEPFYYLRLQREKKSIDVKYQQKPIRVEQPLWVSDIRN